MRRALVPVLLITLVLSACSTRSDRVTDIPIVPTALDDDFGNVGVGACLLAFGPGFGALVREVAPSGAAEGLIRPGDRIIDVGGIAVSTSAGLVAAVRRHAIGDTVTVRLVRNDIEPVIIDVVLGAHPDLAGVPVLGVVAATAEELQPVRTIEFDPEVAGDLVRVVRFDNRYFLFDPIRVRWSPLLGVPVGGGEAFVTSPTEIYQFDQALDGRVVAIGALGGTLAPTAVAGWDVITSLTVIDGTLLVGAIRPDDTRPTGVESAVLGLDAATGALQWTLPIDDQSTGSFVPSSAARDPFRGRAIVRLTPLGETFPESHLLVTVGAGGPTAMPLRGVPDGSLVVGWHARDRVMWVVSPQTLTDLQITDIISGSTASGSLPDLVTGARTVWPVGDGAHVVVSDGTDLLYARVGTDDVRRITVECGPARLGDPGWQGFAA